MGDTRRCPVCGAPVEEGARFCVSCGTRLDGGDDASPEATAAHPPASPANGQPQPSYVAPATPMPSPVPSPEPSHNRGREITIALASVAAALAVVAVVLGVINFMPHQTQDAADASQQAQPQTSNGSADSSQQANAGSGQGGQPSTNVTYYIGDGSASGGTGGGSAPTVVTSTTDDASVLSALRAQRDTLSSYDSQIRSVADDFNRYVKNGSWEQQESAEATATQLQADLRNASGSFANLGVPGSSAYFGTYQSMQTCYADLQNRIDCIVSAWNMRLNGRANYLSPIQAQNDSKGVNVYKTDFENRMASLGI